MCVRVYADAIICCRRNHYLCISIAMALTERQRHRSNHEELAKFESVGLKNKNAV